MLDGYVKISCITLKLILECMEIDRDVVRGVYEYMCCMYVYGWYVA